jgi:prophage tail gpP-like protein
MVWPKPSELAILVVRGQNYQDWESVMVRHAQVETPYYTFRFTCSEPMPFAKNFAVMRIQPGDPCTIILAGEPAFHGLVHTRQVFYDGHRHYIEIQGASNILGLSHASAVSKTGEFNNVSYEQYARALLQPFGIALKPEGGSIPGTKFPRLSNAPGTTVMDALEIPLRSLGGINLTTDVQGNLVAIISSPTGGSDVVEEGKNILEGREIIFNPGMAQGLYGMAQKPGGDEESGAKVSHSPFTSAMQSGITQSIPHVFPLEIPGWTGEALKGRVNADSAWQYEDRITVFITVQGWLRPSGGLWYRNQQVSVISPMLIMQGNEQLFAKTVTFTQDNRSGTRTVLELCNKLAMEQAAGPS